MDGRQAALPDGRCTEVSAKGLVIIYNWVGAVEKMVGLLKILVALGGVTKNTLKIKEYSIGKPDSREPLILKRTLDKMFRLLALKELLHLLQRNRYEGRAISSIFSVK